MLLAAVLASSTVWAGGSDAPVAIESLKVRGVSYTLVVAPAASGKDDPYMGNCARFTVHGTYRYLTGAFLNQPEVLSRDNHLAALAYLQDALRNRKTVNLGWVGSNKRIKFALRARPTRKGDAPLLGIRHFPRGLR